MIGKCSNLRREEEAKATRKPADPRVLNDTPLADQIKDLMLSLPPVQRDRPWSMEELVARLKGRYSPRPHAMNVGQALRALGWTRGGTGRVMVAEDGSGYGLMLIDRQTP